MDLVVAALCAVALVAAVYVFLAVSVVYAPTIRNLLVRGLDLASRALLDPLRAKVGGGWAAYGYGHEGKRARRLDVSVPPRARAQAGESRSPSESSR
jgi:hypothetical protein